MPQNYSRFFYATAPLPHCHSQADPVRQVLGSDVAEFAAISHGDPPFQGVGRGVMAFFKAAGTPSPRWWPRKAMHGAGSSHRKPPQIFSNKRPSLEVESPRISHRPSAVLEPLVYRLKSPMLEAFVCGPPPFPHTLGLVIDSDYEWKMK